MRCNQSDLLDMAAGIKGNNAAATGLIMQYLKNATTQMTSGLNGGVGLVIGPYWMKQHPKQLFTMWRPISPR